MAQVLHQFSPRDRAALLKFVTSCSRAPLGGFEYMNPPFVIHKVVPPHFHESFFAYYHFILTDESSSVS
jgi:hypothetical protein